ncbi:MAG: hypothetical protein Q9188_001236 [Gyalolechia gomerana]
MTGNQVPASIKETVASHTTCTSNTVLQLKQLLFPQKPDQSTQGNSRVPTARLPKPRVVQPTRGGRGRAKKQPDIKIYECRPTSENESGGGKLATEVVNVVLKALTEAVKTRSLTQEPCMKKRSVHPPSPNLAVCSPEGRRQASNPLRPLCANIVPSEKGQSKESQPVVCSDGAKAASGFYAQAECARLAFSALRSYHVHSDSEKRLPALRLENAMSTLVNKLLALELFEPAYRQLLTLKKSLLAAAGQAKIANLIHERLGFKEGMADLLKLPFTNVKGPLLAIAVTFQLQVLRLIAANRDATHWKATVEYLQLTNPYSPIRLIQAQHEPTDTATHAKPASQLEALSRLLISVCPNMSSSEDHNPNQLDSVDPLTAFRSQLLALELRTLWWEKAGHKGDIGKDLLEPFSRFLGIFHRRCATGLADGYTSATSFLAGMTLLGQGGSVPVAVSPALIAIWRSIYTELAEICRQCCLNDEAEIWLEKWTNMPAADEDSPCRRCIVTCQRAVLYARISINPSRGAEIVTSFRNAQQHIEGDLHGGSEDLDELLRVVIRLRKTAASFLNMSRTPLESQEKSPSPELIRQCYNTCSSCVLFLNQYIGKRPLQSADHPSSQRYQQRLKQAFPVIQVFVDTVISTARLTKGDVSDDWIGTDAGLQACLNLAMLARDYRQDAQLKNQNINVAPNIFVSVSNTYWLRYLHMKQNNSAAKETLQALKASINAVEHQPIADKQTAQLQTRLEHYGNVLETAREYCKAVEIYKNAIKTHVEMGHLQKAAAAAATQPVSAVFVRQSNIASLGRVLIAYSRVATKIEAEVGPNNTIFDDNKLEPSQRGVALEYQFFSLVSQLTVGAVVPQMKKVVVSLATELLNVYSEPLFPVRRLRVIDSLMWFRAAQPDFFTPNLVEQLDGSNIDSTRDQPNSLDSGLESLLPYLNASRDAALAIQEDCPLQKQQKVKTAVSCWHLLVEQSPDLEALEARIGDASAWLLHLEILSQYLDVYGLNVLRKSLLDLLSIAREKYFPLQHQELLLSLTRSGLQHLRLGYANQGGLAFHKAMRYVRPTETANEAAIWFYLAHAEYFLFSGNIGRCKENLALAQEMFESGSMEKRQKSFSHDRFEVVQNMVDAALLCSDLAARSGQHSNALGAAKQGLRFAHKAWTSTGKRQTRNKIKVGSIDELVDPMSKATVSDNDPAENGRTNHGTASVYWGLVPQLHKAYLQVAHLYGSEGMFTEAKYYLERSQKLAEGASASGLLSRSLSYLANLLTRSEDFVEANKLLDTASGRFSSLEEDQHHIQFQMNLMKYHLAKGQASDAEQTCTVAESIMQRLVNQGCTYRTPREQPDVVTLQGQLSGMTMGEKASRPPGLKKRLLPGNQASAVTKSINTEADLVNAPNTPTSLSMLRRSRYEVLVQRIRLALQQGKLELASELLSEAARQLCTPQDTVLHAMSSAEISIGQGLDTLKSDPVYCVLPESTISLPSVLQEKLPGPMDPPKPPAPTKAGRNPGNRGPVANGNRKAQNAPKSSRNGLANGFRQAQVDTSKVCQLAISLCPTATVHRLSKIMTETLLNLSALDLPSSEECFKPTSSVLLGVTGMLNKYPRPVRELTSMIDMARSIPMTRGQLTIEVEKSVVAEKNLQAWPYVEMKSLQPSDQSLDFIKFQQQHLELIPQSWQVLNISLSRSRGEILVCRIRSAQSPFILSLPLDRHSSRDPHEESFGYTQAKTELQEIISLADYSTHDGQDSSRKGARSAWWERRAALDARLKDLLTNIENMWFGGFQGVFSQRMANRDLLSSFWESLNVVLDNHLPSRRGLCKKQRSQRISLDPRVVELFVALGDPAFFSDMEEPLMDLLYFVIDILQFHGERNAYDEIDFDSMTIEIFDALRQYYEAAKRSEDQPGMEHTVLILDKELHCFPWESLPCLDGQAVTRLPSLSCLRDRILHQRHKDAEGRFCINGQNGAYVLNPAGDLEATQANFEQPLKELGDWEGLTRSVPTEAQFKEYLQERDIFLYFGHGSGNQYIRSKTIQKMERCAVALLMGCSSGKLTEAGEFEPYGTPMSYMHAGCPAVVATLWDVTDKDIDRFSETVLQKWGLLKVQPPADSSPVKKSTRGKAKGKAHQSPPPNRENLSLDQAVAHGRGSCIFRYLNGAAPVVYGIPIFLS